MAHPTFGKVSVLVIEHDEILASFITEFMTNRGFDCTVYNAIEDCFPLLNRIEYSMAVIDVECHDHTDEDGFIRYFAHDNIPPTIILANKQGTRVSAVQSLSRGAFDYVRKPFSIEELACRMEAILKRMQSQNTASPKRYYRFGKFVFDSLQRQLIIGDKAEPLTTKESELLLLLCQKKGEMLNREQALRLVWNSDNYFNARSMDVYITKLRKLMKGDDSVQILNVHGKGYRFITPGIIVE